MEKMQLGTTELPIEVILEYLESLKEVYTPESYNLFMHNCNNFSNDFSMFLVGKGIPDHITSLPQTFLSTPLGQMLRPQIEAAMRPITQAPTPQPVRPQATNNGLSSSANTGKVNNITTIRDVDHLLELAKDRCAIIFFTSSTCGPCKQFYQPYDDLAAEAGEKCVFLKIDFNHADRSIGTRYPNVRATPTFFTYLRGEKQQEWSGGVEGQLRSNVKTLLEMAFPTHPHLDMSTPRLFGQSQRPILFTKQPPFDKLVEKMGEVGKDPVVASVVDFIHAREQMKAKEAAIPAEISMFTNFLRKSTSSLPPELLFTALDLFRISLVDVRVSAIFAKDHEGATGTPSTVHHLLKHVDSLGAAAPYSLRLTTLHLACNLFATPLFVPHLLSPPLSSLLVSILTTALLDEKYPALKTSALSLAVNFATSNHKVRIKKHSAMLTPPVPGDFELPESEQVELFASLLETLATEEQWSDNKKMALITVGWLVYCADMEGELKDLCKVMDAAGTVGKIQAKSAEDRLLVREIKCLLDA